MKKYITKRNIVNLLGLIAFAIGTAIATGIISAPEYVMWGNYVITLIGYVTNDTLGGNNES